MAKPVMDRGWERFRDGERAALERVYREHVALVRSSVRAGLYRTGRLSSSNLADIVQETFVKAFSRTGRQGYDGTRAYAPYILAIARNCLIDWLRRARREVPTHRTRAVCSPTPKGRVADREGEDAQHRARFGGKGLGAGGFEETGARADGEGARRNADVDYLHLLQTEPRREGVLVTEPIADRRDRVACLNRTGRIGTVSMLRSRTTKARSFWHTIVVPVPRMLARARKAGCRVRGRR